MENLSPDRPLYIDLEITNACPAGCPMCPRDKLPSIGIMPDEIFSGVLKFLDSCKEKLSVCICGIGEPLLHPKIYDYIKMLKQLETKHHIQVVTAGERLTPEVFEKLKELEVDSINLSLQALDEKLYKKLMPGLKLEKVLKNIDYISQNQSSKLDFTISLTVHKINEPNVKDIIEFVKRKNLNIEITRVHTRGGNMMDLALTDSPPVNMNLLTSCNIFETITFISWTGDIYPCAHDIERVNKMGNVNNYTMNELTLRKTGILANGLKYKICSLCNDQIRLGILSEKKIDKEQQVKNAQKLSLEMCKKIGILGENFLSKIVVYKTPDELLVNVNRFLNDILHTLNVLTYLRKKYPHLSVEIPSLEKNQVIDENVLASMNLNRENLTQQQLDNIYSYLINKYGLFFEKIFEKISIMPKQQLISMVYKHFTDVQQFLNNDLNLMYLWKEQMAKKQLLINNASFTQY